MCVLSVTEKVVALVPPKGTVVAPVMARAGGGGVVGAWCVLGVRKRVVALVPRRVTVVARVNFVPVIVPLAPPAAPPLVGLTPVTVGVALYVKPFVNDPVALLTV